MRLDKKQLCNNILGVKERTLKQIESNNKLEERLVDKGYKFIRKYKEGRKVIYELEQISESKEIYSNIAQAVYNTKKDYNFGVFLGERTLVGEDKPLSKADISKKANVSKRTISKWDSTLLDKNIISKDGYFYFYINRETGEICQCSKEEYNNFWKNISYVKAFKDLQLKYVSGVITLNELQLASAEIGATISLIEDKYYYRIKKYKTNKESQLYIDTWKLLKDIYGDDDTFKPYFKLLEENKKD